MRPRFALFLVPLFVALLAPVFAACSNEGEGQPCDPNAGNAGNDDCQSPLVCTTGLTNATGARCCPQNRATATTPECELSSATFDGASPTPPDSSEEQEEPAESSTSEAAPAESGADTGATATDASDGGDAGSSDAPGG